MGKRIEDSLAAQRLVQKIENLPDHRKEKLIGELETGELAMPENRDEKLITPKEFAERCRVSDHTVRRWWKDGKIRGRRVGPRKIFLYESDIEKMWEPGPEESE
jgi:excisionase family DNA binding protein